MRSICLYFQIHQPFRLKSYNIFNLGHLHYYYNDYLNESIVQRAANKSYLAANNLMLELIKKHKGQFKVNFSITGTALDQFELYCPEVIESFKQLAKTGCVEFLGETYSHSLSSMLSISDFKKDVKKHSLKIKELFGQKPKVFRNTELIYSNEIGKVVSDLGFKGMLTEGAKHIMGWRSPNFIYTNTLEPNLKLLLRNYKLSDDIAFRFSDQSWAEYPLNADKYASWINHIDPKDEIVNLFMDYETIGEHQHENTGIFEFFRYMPDAIIKNTNFAFETTTEILEKHKDVGALDVPNAISWADEERDLTAWLGNPLQKDAAASLYELSKYIPKCKDEALLKDWEYLQTSDHFYYMSTKVKSDGAIHDYFTHYVTPYDAYINYMNILSDFSIQLKASERK